MRHYCTLFDAKYLPQGLALYESLVKHSSEPFMLHVLAMDPECELILRTLDLECAEVDSLEECEKYIYGVSKARANRTHQEFCWTMASVFTADLLIDEGPDEMTYLDADIMFFSDPKIVFDEIGDRSIAVIPHRLIPSKKHLEVNGRFNVSWVTFKKTGVGGACLVGWAADCLNRCSAEIGCGDQKYLDEWPAKYGDELCIIQNIGAGVAPWNLANYEVTQGLDFFFQFRPYVDGKLVVFMHYHEFRKNDDGTFRLTNYELRDEDRKYIYEPYIAAYKRAEDLIAKEPANV